eukprot:scaffold512441_cov15-Prasinocladus_malaysianus.AAC.1
MTLRRSGSQGTANLQQQYTVLQIWERSKLHKHFAAILTPFIILICNLSCALQTACYVKKGVATTRKVGAQMHLLG